MIDKKLISTITSRLIETYSPLKIYLFGSYAWGNPTEGSDVDLLVVVEKSEERKLKRPFEGHMALWDLSVSKDIIVYTKKEFENSISDPMTFAYKINNDGKLLYEKT